MTNKVRLDRVTMPAEVESPSRDILGTFHRYRQVLCSKESLPALAVAFGDNSFQGFLNLGTDGHVIHFEPFLTKVTFKRN